MKLNWNKAAWLPVAAGVLLCPLVLGDGYYLSIMNFIALYAMVTMGLCLLTGYGGQLSISHSAFFAIGAYASAVFSLKTGFHPLISLLLGQGLAALIAWGIGAVVLRLKGHYLAIATLSFTIIVEVLIKEMAWLTGGLQGLSGIPPVSLGGLALDTDMRFYYLVWPIALILLLFALNLVDSSQGRVFRAIKEGEDAARLFGGQRQGLQGQAFHPVFDLRLPGRQPLRSLRHLHLPGGRFRSCSPSTSSWSSPSAVSPCSGGGMLGVASLTMLNEYLTVFADYKRANYGLALIVIMLFFPNGLLQGLKDAAALAARSLKRAA